PTLLLLRIRLTRFVGVVQTGFVLAEQQVDVRVFNAVAARAGADLDVDSIPRRTVDQAVATSDAGLETGRIARPQNGFATILAQPQPALDDVHELVLGFVPVPLGGLGPRLEPREIAAKLVEADRVAQPLALAPRHGLAKRLGIAG